MFLAALPKGGHIEFSYQREDHATGKHFYSNYVEKIAFKYFETVSEYMAKNTGRVD